VLIRFGVSNYLSLRDYQQISFVASSLKDEGTDLLRTNALQESLLPAILLYGANASGKSNVLAAFRFLTLAIVQSHKSSSPTGGVPTRPFRLDKAYSEKPTQIDCDIIIEGTRYHYGFTATNEAYTSEWLFAFPQGSRQAWFRREGDTFRFGKHLRGQNKIASEITRANSLFLSAAAQVNHEQLLPLYRFFDKAIHLIDSTEISHPVLNKQWSRDGINDRLLSFLRDADTGIKSFRVDEQDFQPEAKSLIDKISAVLSEQFPTAPPFAEAFSDKKIEVLLGHITGTGDEVFFDLGSESRGTLRLLTILGPLYRMLDAGGILLIDEIDSSLHTILARNLVRLFASQRTNKAGAQLLATTHDTSLLCSTDIRRDQIWFTEKDNSGATHIYPLTDIKTRSTDNLEKGYLQGRFGGIPFFGSSEELLLRKTS
jgi:AAA15 family ATPase/GTPase